MDFIIFRQATNDFMRWSDGEIYVTNDREDIQEQYAKEIEEETFPNCFSLHYKHYFDSEGQKHNSVKVKDENDNEVGFFTYESHLDNDDEFLDALDDWAKDFIKSKKVAR